MATYVPNVGQYLPELKPFTPDYKFLSNVLTTRQTKYDTSYKQLNNAYSRILYSDLSRQDTQGARDQFVNDLQPTLEKISGLDLSLAQNVKAANAVFEPFYQNDLVMKDMVYTKNFKDNVRYAESLMYSNNDETKDKYWREGIEYMGMKMEDFKNASQEQALNMQLEQYVENPQLYKRSLAYLKEQGYDVEIDTTSPDQNFIIKNKNGENITKLALADLQMKFLKDPLINKGYYTKSYVDSRNYANNQMEKGLASSVAQGITQYNTGKLEAYKMSNAAKVDMYDAKIEKYNEQLATVEKEMKGRTPKPGSSIDLAIKKLKNDLLATNMERELVYENVEKAVNLLNSGDEKMINDMGYSVEMQANMMHDLEAAALNYTNRTAKKTIKVNQAHLQTRKEMHDVKMAQVRFNNQLLLEEKRTEEYEKQMRIKKALFPDGEGSTKLTKEEKKQIELQKIQNKVRGGGFAKLDPMATLKDRVIDISDKNKMDIEKLNLQKKKNESLDTKVEAFIQYKKDDSNLIKLPDDMTIKGMGVDFEHKLDGDDVYVNPDNFRKLLSLQNNVEAFKKHINNTIENLTSEENKTISDNSEKITNFIESINDAQEIDLRVKKQMQKLFETNAKNLAIMKGMSENTEMPLIYDQENGEFYELSLDEFNQKIKEQVEKNIPVEKELINKSEAGGKFNMFVLKKDVAQQIQNGNLEGWIIDKKYTEKPNFKGDQKVITKKIFNPDFYELVPIKGNRQREAITQQLENAIPGGNQMRRKMFNKKSIPSYVEKLYKEQTTFVDDILKGNVPAIAEDGYDQMGFSNYTTFSASDDVREQIGDLLIGQKATGPLAKEHVDNAGSYATTIASAFALQDALQNGASVTNTVVEGKDEYGHNLEVVNNKDAFNQVQSIVADYLSGALKSSESNKYFIDYIPATNFENNSKYIITQTQKIAGSQTKDPRIVKSVLEVSLPKSVDRNPLYEENNPDKLLIDALLDPVSNQYKREFGDGGYYVIEKNRNNYTIKPYITTYNVVEDKIESVDLENTSFSNLITSSDDPTKIAKQKVILQKLLKDNKIKVLESQKYYQKGYNEFLKNNEGGKWEEYIKTLSN
jgi:hypothetical protein